MLPHWLPVPQLLQRVEHDGRMKATLMGWTIPTPVLAALGGYLFTYYNTRITEERKARIERVNDQARPTPESIANVQGLEGLHLSPPRS